MLYWVLKYSYVWWRTTAPFLSLMCNLLSHFVYVTTVPFLHLCARPHLLLLSPISTACPLTTLIHLLMWQLHMQDPFGTTDGINPQVQPPARPWTATGAARCCLRLSVPAVHPCQFLPVLQGPVWVLPPLRSTPNHSNDPLPTTVPVELLYGAIIGLYPYFPNQAVSSWG